MVFPIRLQSFIADGVTSVTLGILARPVHNPVRPVRRICHFPLHCYTPALHPRDAAAVVGTAPPRPAGRRIAPGFCPVRTAN